MDIQKSTSGTVTNGLCGLRVSHHQHGFGPHVRGKEIIQIQDHAIQNAHAKKRKKSAQKNKRRGG